MTTNRRNFVKTSLAVGLSAAFSNLSNNSFAQESSTSDVPKNDKPLVIYQADLFHPHGDPDDHFDLATLYSLAIQGLLDIDGLVLDYPPEFRAGDPAVAAVAQMNRLSGLRTPFVVGSKVQPSKRGDVVSDLSSLDSSAVEYLIEALERAERPIDIAIVGSSTDVAIAFSRRPELFKTKCAGVYLDAGGANVNPKNPAQLEFNARLNPSAYATLFDLPCPLYWFPCWDVVEQRAVGPNGTFYWLDHTKAFDGISPSLAAFFTFMFDRSTNPRWIKALEEPVKPERWAQILKDRRGMWSTASILYCAKKTILRDGSIVDHTPEVDASSDALYRMENVRVTCDDEGRTTWEYCEEETNRKLFHILDVEAYTEAMSRAVNSLFRVFT